MSLPNMHGVGRLVEDPELRFSPSGTAVATVPLVFNARKYNRQTGQWEDGDVFFVRGKLFNEPAENATETFSKGMEVLIVGRLKTDRWEDRNTGEKRSATSLVIDAIGPSTRYAKAAVTKVDRRQDSGPPEASTPSDLDPPF